MTATASKKTQPDSLHGPNLILDVENFGPIAEARNIELKPMTVFVGPSNTGKTYLATLFHAVVRSTQSFAGDDLVPDKFAKNLYTVLNDFNPLSITEDVQSLIEPILSDPRPVGEIRHEQFQISDLSGRSMTNLRSAREKFLKTYANDALDDILQIFELPDLRFLTPHGASVEMSPSVIFRDPADRIRLSISDGSVIQADTHVPLIFQLVANDFPHYFFKDPDRYFEYTTDLVYETVENYVGDVIDKFPDSYYFRTGRSGMLDMYREWITQLISQSTRTNQIRQATRPPAFNLINKEFLSWLISLRPNSRLNSSASGMQDVADVIEASVLGGEIAVEDSSGIAEIGFNRNGHTIPIDRASSMVTEIAPITLFIRQFVEDGDLLIIDEPEAHLHPEAQQQMAAALAFMVRSGLRVLITTHSHYMVEQLSAFVNASKLDETTRKRALSLGGALAQEDIYLNEEETAVYSFLSSPEHGGSVVKEIFMGEEFEYGPEDHSTATVKQFNRLQRVLEAREGVEFGDLD